jgi:hypothetical protein
MSIDDQRKHESDMERDQTLYLETRASIALVGVTTVLVID